MKALFLLPYSNMEAKLKLFSKCKKNSPPIRTKDRVPRGIQDLTDPQGTKGQGRHWIERCTCIQSCFNLEQYNTITFYLVPTLTALNKRISSTNMR